MERKNTEPVFQKDEFEQLLEDNPDLGIQLNNFYFSGNQSLLQGVKEQHKENMRHRSNISQQGRNETGQPSFNFPQLQVTDNASGAHILQGGTPELFQSENDKPVNPSLPMYYNQLPHGFHQQANAVKQEVANKGAVFSQQQQQGSNSVYGGRSTPDNLLQGVSLSDIQPTVMPSSGAGCNITMRRQMEVLSCVPTGDPLAEFPVTLPGPSGHQLALPAPSPVPADVYNTILETDPHYQPSNGKTLKKEDVPETFQGLLNCFTADQFPRGRSVDFTDLVNFPGVYGLGIEVPIPPGNKGRNKFCYSGHLDQVYCIPYSAVEVRLKVDDWKFLGPAHVRVCAVYRDSTFRVAAVHRCPNCMCKERQETGETQQLPHLVRLTNSKTWYGSEGERQVTCLPIQTPNLDSPYVTLLVQLACMTSCAGGPNRRLFDLVFSLMVNNEEKGRYIVRIKCCKAPNRDKTNDEKEFSVQNPTVNTTSSQQRNAPGKTDKRKKKCVASTLSSDSEADKEMPKRLRTVTTVRVFDDPQNPGYSIARFPTTYQQKVKECLAGLMAMDRLQQIDPDYVKF